jgi:outer membrane protein insertion porin family
MRTGVRHQTFSSVSCRRHLRHSAPASLCLAVLILALLTGSGTSLRAQTGTHQQYEITSIAFEGNESFTDAELLGQMTTRETPGAFNKFLYSSISERLGRKNEYFNAVAFHGDAERIKRFYENRGFSLVKVDTVLRFSSEEGSADLTVRITEGYRSLIEQVVYGGILEYPETIWEDLRRSPRIYPADPYNSQLLEEEVRRVLRVYADNGFPNAQFVRDSSYARRYTSSNNYVVKLVFSPGHRYLYGDITIRQEVDTARGEVRREDITDEIVLRQLDFAPGDFYSLSRRLSSERSLNRLGIFDLRSIEMFVPPREDSSITVPSRITIRPRDRYELAPELVMSDQDGAFNLGAGLGYTQRNFFGGARLFNARVRFQTQTLTAFPEYFRLNGDAVSTLDITAEVVQPYILTNAIKGTWSFSFILDKQKPYLQNIFRNKFGFTGRFAEFTTGLLEFTLETIELKKNSIFEAALSDPVIVRQLAALQKQQFNSVLSFTIQRDMTNDLFSPTDGFVHAATIEEAGMLPLVLKNVFPQLPFTQFVRGVLVGRWYADRSSHRFLILSSKLKIGIEEKYGESRSDSSRTIPQTHRFYAGGGNSIRGWASRGLIASGEPELGGNLSLEASLEARINLLQSLRDGFLDKIWVVPFVDVGNVWGEIKDFRLNSVAIATGVGIRYETPFGPFRLDWGIRVYDPAATPGSQWIVQRRLLGDTFAEGAFHFGIGHAF